MFQDRESRTGMPSLELKIIRPTKVLEVPRNLPKLGLDEPVELLAKVLGPGAEDSAVSDVSAALKTKVELADLKMPPGHIVPWC